MSDPNFQLKIKGLDSCQIEVLASTSMLISELKHQIHLQTHIPVDRQRLLYNSKHLKNQNSLSFYNISQSSTVQIVANLERLVEEETVSDLIRTALQIFPNSYIFNRRNRDHPRRNLDLSDKLETLRQTFMTIELILSQNRSFPKYLWVDVKDTVDQWLEAQVVEVKPGLVFIHYNGWPSRWDEWLEINSPRVQFFRTNTQQSISSPMYSPYPVTAADSDYCKGLISLDLEECIQQALNLTDRLQVILNTQSQDFQNLPVLLDRLGRAMSDLAGIIGNVSRINEENDSIASSLITNESGLSSASAVRPAMQIPVMPSPSELALMAPRTAQDFEFHIHAFVAMRDHENA